MYFILLILATALAMEGIGSWISIIGLGSLFAGNVTILVMVGILDIAKIVTVSFLYQYWKEIKQLMRIYMTVASCVLVLITSAGAFGYLSGAFQQAIKPTLEVALKVDSLKREKASLETEAVRLSAQREKMDQQIAQLPTDQVRGRQRLVATFKPELDRIATRTQTITRRGDDLTTEILKVESESIERDVHAGPITYLAKAFDVTADVASKWIILTIIAVFDPLAIMLVIAANFLILKRREEIPAPKVLKESIATSIKTPEEVEIKINKIDLVAPPPLILEKSAVETTSEQLKTETRELTAEVNHQEMLTSHEEPVVEEELPLLKSSLEDVIVTVPEALIREGVKTTSIKRLFYR